MWMGGKGAMEMLQQVHPRRLELFLWRVDEILFLIPLLRQWLKQKRLCSNWPSERRLDDHRYWRLPPFSRMQNCSCDIFFFISAFFWSGKGQLAANETQRWEEITGRLPHPWWLTQNAEWLQADSQQEQRNKSKVQLISQLQFIDHVTINTKSQCLWKCAHPLAGRFIFSHMNTSCKQDKSGFHFINISEASENFHGSSNMSNLMQQIFLAPLDSWLKNMDDFSLLTFKQAGYLLSKANE